jgi:hypothetical protein
MDYASHCKIGQMRFDPTSDALTPVLWYRCMPGAKLFPAYHRFANADNYNDDDEYTGIGDVETNPRIYSKGKNVGGMLGQDYCGALSYFQYGVQESDNPTALVRNQNGVPECCAADFLGLLIGGQAVVSKTLPPPIDGTGGLIISGQAKTQISIYLAGHSDTWIDGDYQVNIQATRYGFSDIFLQGFGDEIVQARRQGINLRFLQGFADPVIRALRTGINLRYIQGESTTQPRVLRTGINLRYISGYSVALRSIRVSASLTSTSTISAHGLRSIRGSASLTSTSTISAVGTDTPSAALPVFKQVQTATITSTNTINATFATTPLAGDLILVFADGLNVGAMTFNTPTDSVGNTYHSAGTILNSGYVFAQLFYAYNISTHSTFKVTLTTTASVSGINLQIAEWANIATTSPLDKYAGTTGTSTAPSSGNITSTQAGNLYVGFMNEYNPGDSYSIGGTWTSRSALPESGGTCVVASKGEAGSLAAGTYSMTGTWGHSDPWVCYIASFFN